MRKALWESSAGALAALLNARGPIEVADLYTVTLADGTAYRWTSFDTAVTINGTTWSLGPGIDRSRLRWSVGVSVDDMSLTLYDNVGTTINSKPLMAFIAAGGLQNARVQVDRAFRGAGATSWTGTLLWFTGRVAEINRVTRFEAELSVKSPLELLDVQVPREVYQPGCLNTVYDSTCGANRAAFTVSANVTANSSAVRTTFGHNMAQAAGYFDLGVVTFTTGANAGISRTVKQHTSNQVVALQPWPFTVVVGDQFSIYAGCDKTLSTCTTKFSNKPRFRGMPHIPVAETVT